MRVQHVQPSVDECGGQHTEEGREEDVDEEGVRSREVVG